MESKKVRFIESVKIRNKEGREFKKGEVCELPPASAERWILRGKAEAFEDESGKEEGADEHQDESGEPEGQGGDPEGSGSPDGGGVNPEAEGKSSRKRAKKD